MIKRNNKKVTPYYENHKPLERRYIDENGVNHKIAGWHNKKSGASNIKGIEVSDTKVSGNSTQVTTIQGKNLFNINKLNINNYINATIGGKDNATTQGYVKTYDVIYGIASSGYFTTYISNNGTTNDTIKYLSIGANYGYGVGIKISNNVLVPGLTFSASSTATGGASVSFAFFDVNGLFISGKTSPATVPSNTAYSFVVFSRISSSADYMIEITNIQIEQGSTSTTYTPFVPNSPSSEYPSPIISSIQPNIYTVTVKGKQYNLTLDEELRQIGNVKDTIGYDPLTSDFWVIRNIGGYIFKGTENIYGSTNSGNTALYNIIINDAIFTNVKKVTGLTPTGLVLCSHFKEGKDGYTGRTTENISCYSDGSAIFVGAILKSRLSTVDGAGVKGWFASQYAATTPVIMYYQLKNQKKIPVKATEVNAVTDTTQYKIEDTYNDFADVTVYGDTVQKSDYWGKTGLSSQIGVPTPESPIPITSNLPAGAYKYTSTDGIYEFTISQDLGGIGTAFDQICFDRISHKGYLDIKIAKYIFSGTENFIINSFASTYGVAAYQWYSSSIKPLTSSKDKLLCTHFKSESWFNSSSRNVIYPIGLNGFIFATDGVMSLTDFKALLASNYTTIFYEQTNPVRTSIVFTKVESSTATEVPVQFLTSTPSLLYPAEVYDVSGNLRSRNINMFDTNAWNTFLTANATKITTPNYTGVDSGYSYLAVHPASMYKLQFMKGKFKANTQYTISYIGRQAIVNAGPTTGFTILYTDGSYTYTYCNNTIIWTQYVLTTTANKTIDSIVMGYNHGGYVWFANIMMTEGTTVETYKPYVSTTSVLPTLRSVPNTLITDTYNLRTGNQLKNVSDRISITGDKILFCDALRSGKYKRFQTYVLTPTAKTKTNYYHAAAQFYKYDSTQIYSETEVYAESGFLYGSSNTAAYITVPDAETGMGNAVIPSAAESRAYFYGWRMCHESGLSPFYKSEAPYTPSTWAEWLKTSGRNSVSGTELVFTPDGSSITLASIDTNLKISTKYGILINVTTKGSTYFECDFGSSLGSGGFYKNLSLGNNKIIGTTQGSISLNQFNLYQGVFPVGQICKAKDFRVLELPTGSQIEADFNTKTADELLTLYPFQGLCLPNWKHITDGLGQTATLPTATYVGYTPYKMMYQLASPQEWGASTASIVLSSINIISMGGGWGNVAYACIDPSALSNHVTYNNDSAIQGIVTIAGLSPTSLNNWDTISNIGKYGTDQSSQKVLVFFALGTTLTQAITSLNGKTLLYSKVTPLTLPTYYPKTIVETDCINAIPTMEVIAKVED